MSPRSEEEQRLANREAQRRWRARNPRPGDWGQVPPDWIDICAVCEGHRLGAPGPRPPLFPSWQAPGAHRGGYWDRQPGIDPKDYKWVKCHHRRLRADGTWDYRYVPKDERPTGS
jgi:hypothetical protein